MEAKLLKEIHYLTSLIQQRQQTIPVTSQFPEKINPCQNKNPKSITQNFKLYRNLISDSASSSKTFSKESVQDEHLKPQALVANVHINPNFKKQSPAIHINPKIHTKPLIHINPKIMHNIAAANRNLQTNGNDNSNKFKSTKANINSDTIQTNTKRSIYVNPTLMKKLSSSSQNKSLDPKESISTKRLIKTTNNTNNSNIVIVSRRKLVRVDHAAETSSAISSTSQCKSQNRTELIAKKLKKISPRTIKVVSLVNNASQSINMTSNLPKSCINKSKVTKYKIDRTAVPKAKRSNLVQERKIMNDTMGFITIGDVVYKSSKNRLIRSYPLKRKRQINTMNDKFIITTNGKKLRRLKINKESMNHALETNIVNKTRLVSNTSLKITHKNNISNKVKQKSIQILRNKLRKNNQPCLIFQRFGYCANQKKGLCSKRHDKKQVSLCRNFLQGKCLLNQCPLSHDVGPEKMPTCKYFLDGCCTRDSCPYLHVKVSSNTSVCIEFLQGYCIKGNECQRRHEYLCPEFDKLGTCSKGEYCPYPHKSHFFSTEKEIKYPKKVCEIKNDPHKRHKYQFTSPIKSNSDTLNSESNLRYYEESKNLTDTIKKKRENLMKKIDVLKNNLIVDKTINSNKQMGINEADKSLVKENEDNLDITIENNFRNRSSIGILPAYIPIN